MFTCPERECCNRSSACMQECNNCFIITKVMYIYFSICASNRYYIKCWRRCAAANWRIPTLELMDQAAGLRIPQLQWALFTSNKNLQETRNNQPKHKAILSQYQEVHKTTDMKISSKYACPVQSSHPEQSAHFVQIGVRVHNTSWCERFPKFPFPYRLHNVIQCSFKSCPYKELPICINAQNLMSILQQQSHFAGVGTPCCYLYQSFRGSQTCTLCFPDKYYVKFKSHWLSNLLHKSLWLLTESALQSLHIHIW